MGFTLDDVGRRISWRDVRAVIDHRTDTSALARSVDPNWRWNLSTQLQAVTVDLLAGANWQRGGGQGEKPKPLARPGVGPQSRHHTTTAVPMSQFKARRAELVKQRRRR